MRRFLDRLRPRPATLGERGEQHAARFLRDRGYRILERNLSIGTDEIDLVALNPSGEIIVLIEVKTRVHDRTPPESHVNLRKQQKLSRLAANLRKRRAYRDRPMRFDVIAIVWPGGGKPEVTHYENAFESTY